jgi:hypothetical protein
MIRQISLPTCTLAGESGAAAGTATSFYPIAGELLAVHIVYTGGTSTEDVTISTVGGGATLLAVANNEDDAWYYPRIQACNNTAGSALTLEGNEIYPVCQAFEDYVQVVVAQGGTAANTVDVDLVMRR